MSRKKKDLVWAFLFLESGLTNFRYSNCLIMEYYQSSLQVVVMVYIDFKNSNRNYIGTMTVEEKV